MPSAVDVGVAEFQDPGLYPSWAVDPLMVSGHSSCFDRGQVSATLVAADQVGGTDWAPEGVKGLGWDWGPKGGGVSGSG